MTSILHGVLLTFFFSAVIIVGIWPILGPMRLLRNIVMLPVTVLVRVPLMLVLKLLAALVGWAGDAQDWVARNIPGWNREP